jgi:mannose-6-phosphate isomerase
MSIPDVPDPGWFRTHLVEELLPLWIERAVVPDGPFLCRFDRRWRPGPETAGTLVSQGRLLYNFAQGWELTGEQRYLDAVRSGASFLLEKFRDTQQGGWFWSVDVAGQAADETKESYGHAFLVFGLTHAARASGEAVFADGAREGWDLYRQKFADGRGGFWRKMTRDFRPRDERKTQNPTMHLFEALLDLGDLPGCESVHADARAVADFVLGRLVRDSDGVLPEFYDEEWRELPADRGGWLSIGHQFEWAFLLSRAAERGLGDDLLVPAARMLEGGMRLGYDPREGGTFCDAAPDGTLLSRTKSWWEQCEMVRALLHFAALRGRDDLGEPLAKSVALIRERFIDAEHGGWYPAIGPGCDPDAQHKGGTFKLDYHNAGMCAEAIRLANRPE